MRHSFKKCYLILSSLLIVPAVAFPAALSVNGTCEIGSCTSVDSVVYGQTISTAPFLFNYSVGSDSYGLAGTYTTGYDTTGINIGLTLSAVYLGSVPSTSTDTINVHLLQNFFDNGPGIWDGTYQVNLPVYVGSSTGTGSTLTGQLSFDGQNVGVIGPLGPGTYDGSQSADLSGLSGDILSGDLNLVATFGAGTQPGALISVFSLVPEPSQVIPVALGIVLLGFGTLRKSHSFPCRR